MKSRTLSDGIAATKYRVHQLRQASAHHLSGLFLMRGCPVCDRPTPRIFCIDCQRQIAQNQIAQNQIAQNQIAQNQIVQNRATPQPVRETSLPVIAQGHYSGALKRAILAMKYSDRPEVAAPLGSALAEQWNAWQGLEKALGHTASQPSPSLCAVPIPLHAERQRSRGFNQAELIARAFCQKGRLPLLTDGLIRVQATRPQHTLGLVERQENLSEAFRVGRSLSREPTRRVLLIDDIYTTGTTAISAATVLRAQGISVVGIAVVARAQV